MIRMSRSSIRSYFSPAKKERVGHSHLRAATSRYTSSSVSSDHYMLSTPPPPAHAPLAPSPLQQRFSSSSADSGVSYSTASTGLSGDRKRHSRRSPPLPPPPSYSPGGRGSSSHGHGRWRRASQGQRVSP